MTGSANCDIVSKGRRDLCGVKCIGVFSNSHPANHHSERINVHRSRGSLFISPLEKEKLDDWGGGYDICSDCGAKVLER
jgi:hypothetical protein